MEEGKQIYISSNKVLVFKKEKYIDGYKIKIAEYGCPRCGSDVIPYEWICQKCEQTLKWR